MSSPGEKATALASELGGAHNSIPCSVAFEKPITTALWRHSSIVIIVVSSHHKVLTRRCLYHLPHHGIAIVSASITTAITAARAHVHHLTRIEIEVENLAELEEALMAGADVVIVGIPSQHFRAVLQQVRPHIRAWVPVISLTKGLEFGSNLRMTEIIKEELPGHPVGVLTGPATPEELAPLSDRVLPSIADLPQLLD